MIAADVALPDRQAFDLPAPDRARNTPYRLFREHRARERLAQLAALRDELGTSEIVLVAGYSVKTNPRAEMLVAARECGYVAEVISPEELTWALAHGFSAEGAMYNGPHPLQDGASSGEIGIIFADSVEALRRNVGRGFGAIRGVRLRPTMIESRFGIPVEEDRTLAAVACELEPGVPFAVSFHARREDFNGARWRGVAADVLERAQSLEAAARRPVVAFDVGGGWTPEEFNADFVRDMTWLKQRLRSKLPACRKLIFEAGQAVCTPSEAVVATVLELRRRDERREIVIDAGYSDWPLMHTYSHRLYAWVEQTWEPVGSGSDRLLGRTCLEYDQIDGLRFPPGLAEGDRLAICDAGSYDASMAFDFGRGGHR